MMAENTTSAIRTTAPQQQQDNPETLFAKIVETMALIEGHNALKDQNYEAALAALDDEGGPNHQELVKILGFVRGFVRRQAALAAEKERFVIATAPVRLAWQGALDAWIGWVKAEETKNPVHKAREVISREFWMSYADMELRIKSLWDDGPDAIPAVQADLKALTEEVTNFFVGNWCRTCGVQIPESITPKAGGKAFKPNLCVSCKHAELDEELFDEVVPPHQPKKKGSAAKRHTNGPEVGRKPFKKG